MRQRLSNSRGKGHSTAHRAPSRMHLLAGDAGFARGPRPGRCEPRRARGDARAWLAALWAGVLPTGLRGLSALRDAADSRGDLSPKQEPETRTEEHHTPRAYRAAAD